MRVCMTFVWNSFVSLPVHESWQVWYVTITSYCSVFMKQNENGVTFSAVRNTLPNETKQTDSSRIIHRWIKQPQIDNKMVKNDSALKKHQGRLGRSRACNWTTVVSSSSLTYRSTSAFAAAVIFIGRPEPGLLLMLFISQCFCRNLCIPIRLAIRPFSCNMWHIVGGL